MAHMSTLEPGDPIHEPPGRDTAEQLEGLGIAMVCLLVVGLLAWRTRSWPWHGRVIIYSMVALATTVGAYHLAMAYTMWRQPDFREMPIGQLALAMLAGVVVTASLWIRVLLQRRADTQGDDQ